METAEAYHAVLGTRLLAAYALGSLAHGGFSELVSDVDLGLLLSDPLRPADGKTIQAVADAEKAKGSPLRERLSVFWGTPATLRGERDGGRFPPLDRLDLIENGRLLAGDDDTRRELPPPAARDLLVTGAQFALDYLAGISRSADLPEAGLGSMQPATDNAINQIRSPDVLLRRGVRRVTKIVLFPVRFLYTAATGGSAPTTLPPTATSKTTRRQAPHWWLRRWPGEPRHQTRCSRPSSWANSSCPCTSTTSTTTFAALAPSAKTVSL